MNIRKRLRLLLEQKQKDKGGHEYGCVMLFLDLPDKDWKQITNVVDDEDLYTGEEGEKSTYGKEVDPHVTLLYGIHADVPDEDVEEIINSLEPPKMNLGKVTTFNNNPKFDVLKFDVEGEDLHDYNKKLAELPHTSTYPDYHPHATIAYLKKDTADKYIAKLNRRAAITYTPDKLVYSKPTDDKDSLINYKLKNKTNVSGTNSPSEKEES